MRRAARVLLERRDSAHTGLRSPGPRHTSTREAWNAAAPVPPDPLLRPVRLLRTPAGLGDGLDGGDGLVFGRRGAPVLRRRPPVGRAGACGAGAFARTRDGRRAPL